MFALLNPRLWIALALVAILAVSHGIAYRKGKAVVRAEWNAEKVIQQHAQIAAEKAARAKEQTLQRTKDEAVNAAAKREKKLRADAADARSERDGLRRELADSRAKLSSASSDSLRRRVAALEDVFEQCTERYSAVAEKADRYATDSLMLQEAWPK